jgi:hypothetical protein
MKVTAAALFTLLAQGHAQAPIVANYQFGKFHLTTLQNIFTYSSRRLFSYCLIICSIFSLN